ncbi:hypothetical protein HGM15179_006444 [Zosterops borbonicus]|uniref:Uncharacterized protein n=1 Tax=Zosterops borbonicus TaxID=364589 RepID=A0A8K1GMS4_9PASS|nr:hypothetical protein HGM15179_006444 [Zosterops borbonicus]
MALGSLLQCLTTFSEEIFPHIQSKPLLAQHEAISLCPVPCYMGGEPDPHMVTPSILGVVETNKVIPDPHFLPSAPSAALYQTYAPVPSPAPFSLETLQALKVPEPTPGFKVKTTISVMEEELEVFQEQAVTKYVMTYCLGSSIYDGIE